MFKILSKFKFMSDSLVGTDRLVLTLSVKIEDWIFLLFAFRLDVSLLLTLLLLFTFPFVLALELLTIKQGSDTSLVLDLNLRLNLFIMLVDGLFLLSDLAEFFDSFLSVNECGVEVRLEERKESFSFEFEGFEVSLILFLAEENMLVKGELDIRLLVLCRNDCFKFGLFIVLLWAAFAVLLKEDLFEFKSGEVTNEDDCCRFTMWYFSYKSNCWLKSSELFSLEECPLMLVNV